MDFDKLVKKFGLIMALNIKYHNGELTDSMLNALSVNYLCAICADIETKTEVKNVIYAYVGRVQKTFDECKKDLSKYAKQHDHYTAKGPLKIKGRDYYESVSISPLILSMGYNMLNMANNFDEFNTIYSTINKVCHAGWDVGKLILSILTKMAEFASNINEWETIYHATNKESMHKNENLNNLAFTKMCELEKNEK